MQYKKIKQYCVENLLHGKSEQKVMYFSKLMFSFYRMVQ